MRSTLTVLIVALSPVGLPAARADQLDRLVAQSAGDIGRAVRGLGAKSVAVLKFRVKIGTADPTFDAGTAGADMARRVENVLVLTADPKNPTPVILTGAAAAAAARGRTDRDPLDWTQPDGRERLCELELPVAWDPATRQAPDGFVTGTIVVSPDLRTVSVDLIGFTRAAPARLRELRPIAGRPAPWETGTATDRAVLASLGRSFHTPPPGPMAVARGGLFQPDAAAADAARRPTASVAGPVDLKVYYDGAEVPLAADPDKGLVVPPPKPGQKVEVRLVNRGAETVGALLTVNGKNTMATRAEDLAAPARPRDKFRMWLLEPGADYRLDGFLTDDRPGKETVRPFVVLPATEAARAFDALTAEYAGKVHLFVYGKRPPAPPAPPPARRPLPPVAETPDDVADDFPTPVATDPAPTPVPVEPDPVPPVPPKPPVPEPVPVEPDPMPVQKLTDPDPPAGVPMDAGVRALDEGENAGALAVSVDGSGLAAARGFADFQARVAARSRLRFDGAKLVPARPARASVAALAGWAGVVDGRPHRSTVATVTGWAAVTDPTGPAKARMIGAGDAIAAGSVEVVKIGFDPRPVQSVVVTYYTKPGK